MLKLTKKKVFIGLGICFLLVGYLGIEYKKVVDSKEKKVVKEITKEKEQDVVIIKGSDLNSSENDLEGSDSSNTDSEDSGSNNTDSEGRGNGDNPNDFIEEKKKEEKFITYENRYLSIKMDYLSSWIVEEKFQDYFDIIRSLNNKGIKEMTIKEKLPIVLFNDKDNNLWVSISLNDYYVHDENFKLKTIKGKPMFDYFGEQYGVNKVVKQVGKNKVVVMMYKKGDLNSKDIDILKKIESSISLINE